MPVILVVDDQPRNLQLAQKVLSMDGYLVMTAESGEEALRSMAIRRPDLILLDIVMPVMDGFAVCEKVKSDPATQDIPVIFLSADTEHRSVMTSFSKGGIDYIRKPFNKAELLARVRVHVELHRSQAENARQVEDRLQTLDLIAQEWHSPMHRIALFLTQMAKSPEIESSQTLNAVSKEAAREVDRMLLSIENFLHQQASPDSGQAEEDQRNAGLSSEEIKSMAGKWHLSAKRKLVEVSLSAPSEPVLVSGPAFAVNQVVDVLLSNALNATSQSGRIEVKLYKEGGRLVLKVEDDGVGFPEEYLKRPFQPHTHTSGGNGPTLGVGLAAAKRIADRMGGQLEIGNKPNGGAWATLSLQLS